MVAHSQPAGDPPPGPPPAPAPGGPVPRGRRLRLILAVVGGVLALLCLGGVGIAFILYDDATKINRSEPDAVVDSYLRAYLVDRDDDQASLFTCPDGTGLGPIKALRDDLAAREQKFDTRFTVSWGALATSQAGNSSRVKVDLRLAANVGGFAQADVQTWEFTTERRDEWRVCAARPGS